MINTCYQLDTLDTPRAFLLSLAIGIAFGFFLERAGFGSSRKLSGVFYFRDMAVIKVMFSAVITAALGLSFCLVMGWINLDNVYLIPTVYGAYIVGGLLFGIGFVMGGWCPGTAAVGLAGGKLDALVFLVGALIGSILFNELFPMVRGLYQAGDRGVQLVYETLGMGRATFLVCLGIAAILMFWGCEWLEKRNTLPVAAGTGTPDYTVLKVFTVAILAMAMVLVIVPEYGASEKAVAAGPVEIGLETHLMQQIEQAQDHIEPEELADRLMRREPGLIVVDIRPVGEYARFHLPEAMNIPMEQIHQALAPYKNVGMVVLYSNGMTHPVQARDSLWRAGYRNVYILTDGLSGFIARCLKPVSLRSEPVSPAWADRVANWRKYFLAGSAMPGPAPQVNTPPGPFLIDADWLTQQINRADVKVIDLRPQPEYNTAHIPGSFALNIENLRANLDGVGSMLQPGRCLSSHFAAMGIRPADTVVIVYGDKTQDATLVAIALERVGHPRYTILNGGFSAWKNTAKPLDQALPEPMLTAAQPVDADDGFTVDYPQILKDMTDGKTIILDVRPVDYFTGAKSDEARAGHIPGAINRPYTEDLVKVGDIPQLKTIEDLKAAYQGLIPSLDSRVVIHCRTGHQASQTFFVLKRLLGYRQVFWYDAGWSQWAARPELPVVSEVIK